MNKGKEKELSTSANEESPSTSTSDIDSLHQDDTTNSDNSSNISEENKEQDKLKGRHFWYVVYPESAPEDWIEQLKQTGLAFCISPLHDKDKNPDETNKKAHYHVIISWGNSTTYKSARALCDTILHCPRPQILKNVTGAYRYHQHKDNPEKYQYEEPSKTYNGWERPLDSSEVAEIKKEIHKLIYVEDIQEYGELLTVCSDLGPEYFDVASNNTFYCEKLCTSYRHNPLRGLKRYFNSLDEGETKELIERRIHELMEVKNYEGNNTQR